MTGAPIRVAMATSWLSARGGGIASAVAPLARALNAGEEVAVDLLAFDRPDAPDGTRCIVCPARGPAAFPLAPAMATALRRGRYDVVHVHGLWSFASLAARAASGPARGAAIVSPHGMLDAWALGHSARKKRLARLAFEDAHLRRAACLHALNAAEAEAIRGAGFANPIAVIPNGVDLPPTGAPGDAAPCAGDTRRILLFLGRLHPKKGLDRLIAAWARLVGNDPALAREWRLVVAGWDDGGHRAALERLAGAHDIAGHVSFPGPLHGVAKDAAFRAASAVVLPSHSEGLPMAVLEAWSHARPVLMTTACNLPEGFAAGAAFRIEGEPDAIAATLREALARPDRLAAAGAAGRALVARAFAWEQIAARWAELHRWLAGRTPRPEFVR